MSQHHGPRPGRARDRGAHVRPLHVLGLFVFYAALAFGVFAFTFFYIFTRVEFGLVIVLTLVIAVVATAVHIWSGRRTRVDSLVDKGL
jgi:tryptophan-rich sensory protein